MSQSGLLQRGYNDKIRNAILNEVANDLAQQKSCLKPGQRLSSRLYNDAMQSLAAHNVHINQEALKKRVARASDDLNSSSHTNVIIVGSPSSTPSTLTAPSTANTNTDSNDNSVESPPSRPQRKAGRPKGTTMLQKFRDKLNAIKCVDTIAHRYAEARDAASLNGQKRLKRGFLQTLIKDMKKEFGVTDDIDVQTFEKRYLRGNLSVSHRGVYSPLAPMEDTLVEICIQMGKIRQPINCTEALQLANNLIEGTEIQEKLIEFQLSRKICGDDFVPGNVSKGWWIGFLERHDNKIVTKRGEKFAISRSDWTTLPNIRQMYDVIYDELEDAGIAVPFPEPQFVNMEGIPCDESEAYSKKLVTHKLAHPHYFIVADETGCNTSQKKDGHVGGEKFICEKGDVPQQASCTSDHKFTMLPFTAISGEAVCCVVIFESESEGVPWLWETGVDYQVDPVMVADAEEEGEEKIDMSGVNVGDGKYFPGGPKCKFNGKVVDCVTYVSKSGGITAEILVEILKYFDSIDLFPRDTGITPLLLVDGHQSRLSPIFIDYINDDGHPWKVCLGVPYATSLWQQGDSSEHNGAFKVEWSREKADLLKWKTAHPLMGRSINAEDIMPLLSKTFHKTFGNVRNSKKAAADRGWNPLNRKLEEHPSLQSRVSTSAASTVTVSPPNNGASSTPNLNVEDGFGGTCLDRIIQARERTEGCKRAAEKRKSDNESKSDRLKKARKLTAGVIVKEGIHCLNDPEFVQPFLERIAAKAELVKKKANNERVKLLQLKKAVIAIRQKYGDDGAHLFRTCTKDECGSYLQYKKKSKDPGMPKEVAQRRIRCVEWMNRPSPPCSPHASDDELEEDSVGDAEIHIDEVEEGDMD
jgi:hypothetical protein